MIYARQPTDEEITQLQTMIRRETGRVSQRARMILLSMQHRTTTELAEIFATDKVTVRRWIHRFNLQGPAGLYDVPRPGRPRKHHHPQIEEHQALPPPMPAVSPWSPTAETMPDRVPHGIVPEGIPHRVVPDDAMAQLDERPQTRRLARRFNWRKRRPTRINADKGRHLSW
jgi:Helix-turn-helix domain